MPKRWGKKGGQGGPRRSWHGADRETALFDTYRKSKRRKRWLRDGAIFTSVLVATFGIGLFVTNRDRPEQTEAPPPPPDRSPPPKDPPQPPVPRQPQEPARDQPPAPEQRSFGYCYEGGGANCVVDGDTFWMDGIKIRIADIDTPETHPPRCAQEGELGNRATERLRALLNAGPITLAPIERDEDRYGRKLRLVMRDGVSLADTLIAEGLARRYRGGPKAGWCD